MDRSRFFGTSGVTEFLIRRATPADARGAYYVCLKTGNHGEDAESLYRDDPEALGRIYVGPYLVFEPDLSFVLEDEHGICGYAFGALDSRKFYARYEAEWRPSLCARFPAPAGDPSRWTPAQRVHQSYHQPDYFCPDPYARYPSHLHIDLLPHARGRGYGRRMLQQVMDTLRRFGSPGAHLGVSSMNTRAIGFYAHLGFRQLVTIGSSGDGVLYMGVTWMLPADA
jgi:ribosomal protein S18 acetylase RimI-like enzyme